MGKKAVQIANLDVEVLLETLNRALAEEWLAFYQYWVGARLMEGPMRSEVEPELLVHATQELNHAVMVVTRIIQLGGTPLLDPREWFEKAECAYDAPNDPYIEEILNQNLSGERCAISRYQGLAEMTNGKDLTTYQMAITILAEEIEHEEDIESWIRDIERLKDDIRKLRL
ncbi:MAG: ferritin-like domain-containing protein [Erysipelotrichaceae bacterium]